MKITQRLSEHNLFRVVAIFWTITMIYLCLVEVPKVPKFEIPFKDKIVHFSFYFGFVYFWIKSFKNNSFIKSVVVFIIGVILGIAIELLQENFTKNRTFDYYDILANTIGAIASLFFVNRLLKNKKVN